MSKIIVKDLAGPASSSNKIYIASGSELDIAGSSGTINLAINAADITSGTLSDGRFADDSILFIQTAVIAADSTIQADPEGTWTEATGCNITVPAASVNRCSKLHVCFNVSARANEATHTIAVARITRSAPSTADSDDYVFGAAGSAPSECYDTLPVAYTDSSLSNADHTYKIYYNEYGGTTSYSATIYPRYRATVVTVIGIK